MTSAHTHVIDQGKMATSDAALPPMGKISMVGIWMETVLYGTSFAVAARYLLQMFTLPQVSSKSEWLQRARVGLMSL